MQQEEITGKLAGTTRRSFIRGIAAAGASTAAAYALERGGVASLLGSPAHAHGRRRSAFSSFEAIGASPRDVFEVPAGFRADVLISWGDRFRDTQGNVFEYGFNNDFLAYFPLRGSDEGILFINHEYPGPFYQHGFKPDAAGLAEGKTLAEVEIERKSVGNSILHVRRGKDGLWKVVSPSRYNTRIYGGDVDAPEVERSLFDVTGPVATDPRVGTQIWGSVGNCSGGITPWGTAISCEENFDGYGMPLTLNVDFNNGWYDEGGHEEYLPGAPYRDDPPGFAKYGWVCEHDVYDPRSRPRKHTALGRFRHENTAYRASRGKRFVIYMGDDKNNEGVYKFVSDRSYHPRDRHNNRRILESGTLYIAKWLPEGRRRFANPDGTGPLTPPAGTGQWVEVLDSELIDTATLLRARIGTTEYDTHYATNRPEDLEVDPHTGDVYIAFTNNTGSSGTNDVHGAVRRLQEDGNDPEAMTFRWDDYANGGPTGRADEGERGFSCVDNLVFDKRNDLWIVTDISTGSLNQDDPARPDRQALAYHANNALFYVPTDEDPEDRIAYRFANMPVESEGTGPYFTPDESALFVNVQHPGELANTNSTSIYGQPATYTSYWPDGENSPDVKRNPALPKPSTVVITRPKRYVDGMNEIPRPAGYVEPKPPRGHDHDHDSDSDSDRGWGSWRDRDSDSD